MKDWKRNLRQIITILTVIQYGVISGIETVYVAVFAGSENFQTAYGNPSSLEQGLMTASVPLMGTVGAILAIFSAVKMNKKFTIHAAVTVWTACYFVSSFVIRYDIFILTRCIRGVVIGLISPLVPLYIKEVFTPEQAAKLLGVYQATFPVGIVIMAASAMLEGVGSDAISFSDCWLIALAPVITVLLSGFFVRRSPRDIICRSRTHDVQDAEPAIKEICKDGKEADESFEIYTRSFDEIKKKSIRTPMKLLFTVPYYRARLQTSVVIQICVQLTGMNVILYYIGLICQMAGLAGSMKMITLGIYVANMASSLVSAKLAVKLPRLSMIRAGLFLLGTVHVLIWVVMCTGTRQLVERDTHWQLDRASGIAVISLCFLFVVLFSLFIAGSALLYVGELLPAPVRDSGLCISTATSWLFNFAVAIISPTLFSFFAHYSFILYAAFNYLFFVVTAQFDETHSRMEEGDTTTHESQLSTILP